MTGKPNSASKTFRKLSLGVGVLVALLALWIAFAPDRWVYGQGFKVSELMIQEAENFRNAHGS